MNALVQYDSSSEDEGSSPKPPQPAVNETAIELQRDSVSSPASNKIAEASPQHDVQLSTQGPVMGPTVSTNENSSYEGYEEVNYYQPAMSERDMIRYLTQATHPMTAMPPSPPGSPNRVLGAKFRRFVELKAKGVHFNEDLARKDAFKNPSLLTVMMDRAGLSGASQYSTSLPVEVLDLSAFPTSAFKDELLKDQQAIRAQDEQEKKILSVAGKRTIDFAPASVSETSSRNSTPGLHTKRKRP